MPRYVAFLRGINLGRRRLTMRRLRQLCEELGFKAVDTFIASGNVLFSTRDTDARHLEERISGHLETVLGYRVESFVRTAEEVVAIGTEKVFPEDGQPGITIHVGFLHEPLAPEAARTLAAVATRDDEFHVHGREYYWLCRVRSSDSSVWRLPELKALRLPSATMRNLRSLRKLIAMHFPPGGLRGAGERC